jgi:Rha family phage regulatory protein
MSDLSEFVTLSETTLTTDSRRVAKHFGKRHDSVLRAFDAMNCEEEFSQRNFAVADEPDAQGKLRRIIRMTKDGFALLAMGFTGPQAMKMKVAYINAFNAMADQLQQIGMSLWNQRLELEKKDATSFMWASFGAKRMLDRKKALPDIKETRQRLKSEMEPALFGGSELLQ